MRFALKVAWLVFRAEKPCGLIDTHPRLGGTECVYLQPCVTTHKTDVYVKFRVVTEPKDSLEYA
jgi:hypothetical protein